MKFINIPGKITSPVKMLQACVVAVSGMAIRGKCVLRH